jgi:hypothetical protein
VDIVLIRLWFGLRHPSAGYIFWDGDLAEVFSFCNRTLSRAGF